MALAKEKELEHVVRQQSKLPENFLFPIEAHAYMAEKLSIDPSSLSFKVHPSIDGHGHAYFYEAPSFDGTGRVYSTSVYGVKVTGKKEGYVRVLDKVALDFCIAHMIDHADLRNAGIVLE